MLMEIRQFCKVFGGFRLGARKKSRSDTHVGFLTHSQKIHPSIFLARHRKFHSIFVVFELPYVACANFVGISPVFRALIGRK